MRTLQSNDETSCHSIVSVVQTFADVYLDWISQGSPLALQVVDMILAYASHPRRQIASVVLDFWLELQTTEPDSRHSRLRHPEYCELLHVLIQQSMYPLEFTTGWDSYTGVVEEDDFRDFWTGSQGVTKVFIDSGTVENEEEGIRLIREALAAVEAFNTTLHPNSSTALRSIRLPTDTHLPHQFLE